jgi:hypothetical protein
LRESILFSPTSAEFRSVEEAVEPPAQSVVIIRDFAFPSEDPRYAGEPHPDADKQSPRDSHRLSESVFDSADGLGSVSATSFSWGFVTSNSDSSDLASDRTTRGPLDLDDGLLSDDDGDDADDRTGELDRADLPEIPPTGLLYVAAYPFEPEAPQEMRLEEGDLVRVWERVCAGWVVAGRVRARADGLGAVADDDAEPDEEMESGLVPEDFLVRYDVSTSSSPP